MQKITLVVPFYVNPDAIAPLPPIEFVRSTATVKTHPECGCQCSKPINTQAAARKAANELAMWLWNTVTDEQWTAIKDAMAARG